MGQEGIKASPQRYLVLFILSLLAFNQCMMWLTFSAVAWTATDYLNVSDSQIQLILNYGPIFYFVSLPLVIILADRRAGGGLRLCVLTAAILQLICGVIRAIVVACDAQQSHVWAIHVAQVANAISGPLVMATPAQLSLTWFAENELVMATAIGTAAASLGSAFAFLVNPQMVNDQASAISDVIYRDLALSIFAVVLAQFGFPSVPKHPPSKIALDIMRQEDQSGRIGLVAAIKMFISNVVETRHHKRFLIITLVGGAVNGIYSGWVGMMILILEPVGYSETETGWMTFSSTIAYILGTIVSGFVADKYFRDRFKLLIIITLAISFVSSLLFTLSLPSSLWPDKESVLDRSWNLNTITLTIFGHFVGWTVPLFFEQAVEMTYGHISEATAGSVLTGFFSLGSCAFLVIPLSFCSSLNAVMTATVVVTIAVVAMVDMDYKKPEGGLDGISGL